MPAIPDAAYSLNFTPSRPNAATGSGGFEKSWGVDDDECALRCCRVSKRFDCSRRLMRTIVASWAKPGLRST